MATDEGLTRRITTLQATVKEQRTAISELEALLASVTPSKDAEGIILKAKRILGGGPADSLIQLCLDTRAKLTEAQR